MKHIKSKNSDLESVEIKSRGGIQKINNYIQHERTKSQEKKFQMQQVQSQYNETLLSSLKTYQDNLGGT
jgi:hypothetical protein